MCGICGIVRRGGLAAQDPDACMRMNGALVHRGPDASGEMRAEHAMLAMRRLSIIDVAGANQPLWNEDRTVAMVFNGEIYNYVELRQQLERSGHILNTHGDGETIPHLYEEFGLDFVRHLRGMFAIALWDSSRKRLVLARDRMGEKPLYLNAADGRLAFSSELRSLLSSGLVAPELDPIAVNYYFHYGYVPEPHTPLRGIRKLDAGCMLILTLDTWSIEERRYWDMEDAPALEGDPAECLRAELESVSEIVVRSDVPVGVALSGGLDSSAVAALAARKYPGKMHAFTVGYPGRPGNDEREDAQKFAEYLGIPFHDTELRTEDMVEFFPELVWRRDDPIADISGYGYYSVARLSRDSKVPVLLHGQGGDELFWGYNWVREAVGDTERKKRAHRRQWAELPAYLRLSAPPGLKPWQMRLWLKSACGLREGWEQFSRDRSSSPQQFIFYDKHIDFQEATRKTGGFYPPAFAGEIRGHAPSGLFAFAKEPDRVDIRMTSLIASTFLRENGVAQGDRLSMASSVEMRLPFLDYRFVETVIGLRKRRSDHHLGPKAWFKESLRGVLPDWVLNRPKKAFQPPVREWYVALLARYGSQLDGGCLVRSGVLRPEVGRNLATGPIPWTTGAPLCFKALLLEIWCRRVLEPGNWGRQNA